MLVPDQRRCYGIRLERNLVEMLNNFILALHYLVFFLIKMGFSERLTWPGWLFFGRWIRPFCRKRSICTNGQSGLDGVNLWRWASTHYLVSSYQVLKWFHTTDGRGQKTRGRLVCVYRCTNGQWRKENDKQNARVFWPIVFYTTATKTGQLVAGGFTGLFIPTSLARQGKLRFILCEC